MMRKNPLITFFVLFFAFSSSCDSFFTICYLFSRTPQNNHLMERRCTLKNHTHHITDTTSTHSTAHHTLNSSPPPPPHTHTRTHHTITEPSHTTGLWSFRQSGTDNRRNASMGCDESEHGWAEATGSDGARRDGC